MARSAANKTLLVSECLEARSTIPAPYAAPLRRGLHCTIEPLYSNTELIWVLIKTHKRVYENGGQEEIENEIILNELFPLRNSQRPL